MSSGTLTPRQDGAHINNNHPDDDLHNMSDTEKQHLDNGPIRLLTFRVFFMGIIVSIGGLIFGYDTGQISGILEMENFLQRFHSGQYAPNDPNYVVANKGYYFSDVRSGTIVGLLSIGTLIGALVSAPIADTFGRKICIFTWNVVFCVGVIVQITTENHWYQIVIGRWVAGLGVGGLSVLTPMYQSETAPRQIRGAMVSTYQLFITLGIFIANCVNYSVNEREGDRASSWRTSMGVGFIFPVIMVVGMCFLPESPRWEFRHNKVDSARQTVAHSYGVSINHYEVHREMGEIKAKLEAENAGGGKHKFYEVVTGPRMAYRVALGVTLQALQQLTGANFFFYYGTTIFQGVSINSFITAMILAAVNFVMTFPGLWVVENLGRRKALISGATWMFCCFMVFASVGNFALSPDAKQTPHAAVAMIVFACLFIAGYAMTWGPIVWAVVGEMFPTRYRAGAMGISSASNWTWNFLISFFSPFITKAIGFRYGYVFAACNAAAVFIVYFFLCEHRGRTLEEIDTMYITHVPPTKSSSWQPSDVDELVTADALHLEPGARGIRKANAAGMENTEKNENLPPATASQGIHDVSGTDFTPEITGARGASVSH